jgi:aryl-alcohol dehydrogenase-like predicted oxidoreductase
MEYNFLGDTGLLVSELCFGTMTFGGEGQWKAIGQQQQEEADALIEQSLEAGVNFIDTANVYSYGQSEAILGNSLQNLEVDRDEVVVATKVRGPMSESPNDQGLSRYHIFNSVDDSLERLQLDTIDLLYVHGIDSAVPTREIMHSLHDVVESGRVRYLGVCNWPAWRVMEAQQIARREGWHEFKAMQYFYSLSGRDAEDALIPLARQEDLAFLPWSPLAGGFLTGKFTRDSQSAEGARRDEFDFPPIDKEQGYDIVEVLEDIADDHDASVAEIALAWVRHQTGVTSTIIGARNADQLESNLNSANIELEDDELAELDEVSETPARYPFWMVGFQDEGRSA